MFNAHSLKFTFAGRLERKNDETNELYGECILHELNLKRDRVVFFLSTGTLNNF